jgi:hypothetical protein
LRDIARCFVFAALVSLFSLIVFIGVTNPLVRRN